MSKLAKAISAVDSSRRVVGEPQFKYTEVRSEWGDYTSQLGEVLKEYKVGTVLQNRILINPHAYTVEERDALHSAVKNCKKAMIEEIFGEFRGPLYDIRAAMYDRDNDKAIRLLNKLESQMFHEGIEE